MSGAQRDVGWSKLRAALGVLALFVLHSLATARWMYENGFFTRPPPHDAAWFRLDAQRFGHILAEDGVLEWLKAGLAHHRPHPPVLHLVASLFGTNELTSFECWLSVQFFGLIFVLGVYRLARNFLARPGAVLAVLITLCTPIAAVSFRHFFTQFPMAAFVGWSFHFLIRSCGFTRLRSSVSFGIAAGLATLTKVLAPIAFLGAAAWVALKGLTSKTTCARTVLGLALGTLAATLVLAPWMSRHYEAVFQYTEAVVGTEGQATFSHEFSMWHPARWLYYPVRCLDEGVGLLMGSALLVAIVVARRARVGLRGSSGWPFVGTAVVAWILTTLGQTGAGAYYFVALSPLPAVFGVRALAALPRSRTLAALKAALILGMAWNLVLIHRPFTWDRSVVIGNEALPQFAPRVDRFLSEMGDRVHGFARPTAEPWPGNEFASLIDAAAEREVPVLVEIPHQHPFMGRPVMELVWDRLGRRTENLSYRALQSRGLEAFPAAILGVDFIIYDGADYGPKAENIKATLLAAGVEFEVLATHFVTENATPTLLQLKHPWVRRGWFSESILEGPLKARVDTRFENGCQLRGFELIETRETHIAVALFWTIPSGVSDPLHFHIEVPGARSGRRADVLTPRRGAVAGEIFAVTTMPFLPPEKPEFRLRISTQDAGFVRIQSNTLRTEGDHWVVFP